jgi:ParB-like chromosome segregation protein Spo0J
MPNTAPTSKIVMLKVAQLKPHPLSARIYGRDLSPDLVESIAQQGVLEPWLVTVGCTNRANRVVISGSRRLAAARRLSLKEVPTILPPLKESLEIEQALLEANRYREKTNEQKAREYAERKRIEGALSKRRMKSGKSADGQASGRGKHKANEKKCLKRPLQQ